MRMDMCVALFVAEREQKRPVYQRLLRHKHNWLVMERVKGIEPSYSAWKAAALPLSYTRARPIHYHATEAASTAMHRALETASVPSVFRAWRALNRR